MAITRRAAVAKHQLQATPPPLPPVPPPPPVAEFTPKSNNNNKQLPNQFDRNTPKSISCEIGGDGGVAGCDKLMVVAVAARGGLRWVVMVVEVAAIVRDGFNRESKSTTATGAQPQQQAQAGSGGQKGRRGKRKGGWGWRGG